MVLPHHTPYVTPQILHKNYAQAHDSEQFGTLIGKDLEYFSQAGFEMDKIQLKRNAPVHSSMKMLSGTKEPSSLRQVL